MAASDPIFLGIGGPPGVEAIDQIDAFILFGLTDGEGATSQVRRPAGASTAGGGILAQEWLKRIRRDERIQYMETVKYLDLSTPIPPDLPRYTFMEFMGMTEKEFKKARESLGVSFEGWQDF